MINPGLYAVYTTAAGVSITGHLTISSPLVHSNGLQILSGGDSISAWYGTAYTDQDGTCTITLEAESTVPVSVSGLIVTNVSCTLSPELVQSWNDTDSAEFSGTVSLANVYGEIDVQIVAWRVQNSVL